MTITEPAHTIACMDSWAIAKGLPTYTELRETLRCIARIEIERGMDADEATERGISAVSFAKAVTHD